MRLRKLPYDLTVCKLSRLPECLAGFYVLAAVENEISLVCESRFTPNDTLAREDGWRAFMVNAQMDFSLVGILAKLSSCLADQSIPLFAFSTYDTDYLLVKEHFFKKAEMAFQKSGYTVLSD